MPSASKRLDYLLKVTGGPPPASDDPFVWYALAMEYRALERHDEALATFEALRSRAPGYVPAYLMCGQMLEKMGRADDARAWLSAGVQAAEGKGDAHAASELRSALDALRG